MASDGIDWGKLVEQGRAKALGVSWSESELKARYELKIPAEFVRAGCLTLEDYKRAQGVVEEEIKQGKKKPLRYMSKGELLDEAKAKGLQVSDETTRAELILLIDEKDKGNIGV